MTVRVVNLHKDGYTVYCGRPGKGLDVFVIRSVYNYTCTLLNIIVYRGPRKK